MTAPRQPVPVKVWLVVGLASAGAAMVFAGVATFDQWSGLVRGLVKSVP